MSMRVIDLSSLVRGGGVALFTRGGVVVRAREILQILWHLGDWGYTLIMFSEGALALGLACISMRGIGRNTISKDGIIIDILLR